MFFGKNIKYLRETSGDSQAQFAEKLGLKRTTLAGYEANTSFPDFQTLIRIAGLFGNDLNRLVHSDLSVTNEKWDANLIANLNANPIEGVVAEKGEVRYLPSTQVKPVMVVVGPDGNEKITIVDVKAAAGYPANIVEPSFVKKLPTLSLPGKEWHSATFRCFQVAGDSMYTTLWQGDFVICQYLDQWPTQIKEGYVHVVVTRDAVFVKRILNRTSSKGQLVLKSDNKIYPAFTIDVEDVQEVWLVKRVLSALLIDRNNDIHEQLNTLHSDVADLREALKRLQTEG